MEHPGDGDVADVLGAPGEELRVLLARDALADPAQVLEGGRVRPDRLLDGAHRDTSWAAEVAVPWPAATSGPAAQTALTMFW